ncbi:MAG: imidazole glycerol phosphate synthase cyclase subunit [Candidatus Pacebacteria bacterium]|nr:imidazole glycerol phosphate synthase cyclase subunit [Candidatus Paceibacterota bacterium]
MLKKRLIPCLLLQNGQLVKSIGFKEYQIVGNPKIAIQFFNAWAVDEIIFLDISKTGDYTTLLRKDYNYKTLENIEDIIKESAKICFVPLTVGGGIKNIGQMTELFKSGADKVIINTEAFRRPEFITEAAKKFGSQAIVVSIDAKKNVKGEYEVFIDHGQEATGVGPAEWAKKAGLMGAGEIFLTSIDKDGSLQGYDLELLKKVTEEVKIPVIACGGVGKWQDLVDGVNVGGASAVSAANIFHFTEQSTKQAKKHMKDAGLDVRI